MLSKLQAEIDAADKAGKLSSPVVQYLEGEKLSYVQACIKEALRLYPSFSGRLSRTTTDVGAEVLGRWVPPNTEIGNCLAVSNRIKAIYGKDAEDFVPERWLPLDGERAKEMNKYLGTFGYGVRTCIGKNVAMMEMTKTTTEVLLWFLRGCTYAD